MLLPATPCAIQTCSIVPEVSQRYIQIHTAIPTPTASSTHRLGGPGGIEPPVIQSLRVMTPNTSRPRGSAITQLCWNRVGKMADLRFYTGSRAPFARHRGAGRVGAALPLVDNRTDVIDRVHPVTLAPLLGTCRPGRRRGERRPR